MNSANLSYSTPNPVSSQELGYEIAKRVFDVAISFIILLISLPLMAGITLLICLDSPGGAFFIQERVGKEGLAFRLFKFRSMYVGTPNLATADMIQQKVVPITKIGYFLRRSSLDELPQLLNVLIGEMSLVGPRPALFSQKHLNELRINAGVDHLLPGITGWAQINGRDELSDEQKVAHDVYYRHYRSFKLDLIILVRTLSPVLTGRGNR